MTNNDLINKIKRLEKLEPSESWLRSNREFILKYIDADGAGTAKKEAFKNGSRFGISGVKYRLNSVLSIFQHKMLVGATAMAAILVMAGGAAVGRAENSLPGDNLYALKTFIEKTQMAFTFDDEKRVALNFEFTEKRLDEFSEVVAKGDGNADEVKVVADNLKNQLKAAAQELDNAKTGSSSEKAVSAAKIAGAKTTAYAKKLSQVKKGISDEKQVQEVAANIETLNNIAFAVLVENSKEGGLNTEEIVGTIKEKIADSLVKIDELEEKVTAYGAEINSSSAENSQAVESLALSVKLVSEAKDVMKSAEISFKENNFSKTLDLIISAEEIIKVADNVGARVAVKPEPSVTPVPSASPVVKARPTLVPTPTIVSEISPEVSPEPEPVVTSSPSPTPEVSPTVSPTAEVSPSPKA